jgi:hypothetical protein
VPPPLIALVLAVLLLARSSARGVFVVERLLNQNRTALENGCGAAASLALVAASAQMFNLLTPDTGLLHVLVSVLSRSS